MNPDDLANQSAHRLDATNQQSECCLVNLTNLDNVHTHIERAYVGVIEQTTEVDGWLSGRGALGHCSRSRNAPARTHGVLRSIGRTSPDRLESPSGQPLDALKSPRNGASPGAIAAARINFHGDSASARRITNPLGLLAGGAR